MAAVPGTAQPRVALVTGASAGIGRAVAVALGGLGWVVAIGARRRDRLEETADQVRTAGGTPFAHDLDVTDAASVEELFAVCERSHGVIDVVVNNAGMSTPDYLDELTPGQIATELATNLLGPMLVARRAIQALRAADATGDLVYVTSDAVRNARPRQAVYTASKAGLEQFARSVSMELEGTGIRSTIVRVGPTFSDFGIGWDAEHLHDLMTTWQHFGLQRHRGILQPADIARAVVTAVTNPPHVFYDTVEVQPLAPRLPTARNPQGS